MVELTPPDRDRCQADVPGNGPFTMGGPIGDPKNGYRVRCGNKPTVIVTEREFGQDGQRGSMSLCEGCLAELHKQKGRKFADVQAIVRCSSVCRAGSSESLGASNN